jgi:hypothetical protein
LKPAQNGAKRDTYLVDIDFQAYRDLVVSIKEHHRAGAATAGLMIRHAKQWGIHSERIVLTPTEAINRALPGYPGTPMYALDIWHTSDYTGRICRVWVASPAIRDAWIAAINKAA